jgi:hypothetical protein
VRGGGTLKCCFHLIETVEVIEISQEDLRLDHAVVPAAWKVRAKFCKMYCVCSLMSEP